MKSVEAFQAKDGTLHRTREIAARHDIEVYFSEALIGRVSDFPESIEPLYRLLVGQASEQLANDNSLLALFRDAIQASRDDGYAATSEAVGIPMQVEAQPEFPCAECQWHEHCTNHRECHISASRAQVTQEAQDGQ